MEISNVSSKKQPINQLDILVNKQNGDNSNKSTKMETPPTRWADIMDEEDRQAKLQKKKKKKSKKRAQAKRELLNGMNQQDEVGRELFVGNLCFDDLESVNVNTTVKFQIRNQRREAIIQMFHKKFPDQIVRLRTFWTRGFLFLLFHTQEQAANALSELQEYEHRKELCRAMRSWLEEKKYSHLAMPRACFYMRWTKFLVGDDDQKTEEMEKI
jgi:RNA recognition motif-containing protein